MRSIMQKWGKHIAAVAVFLVLTVVYFAPAVFEGKSIRQGDMEKAVGWEVARWRNMRIRPAR